MTTKEHADVVRLPGEDPVVPPPSPPSRAHGLAIAAMGVSALVGVTALLLFITVTLTDDFRRYVIGVFLFSGVVFLASAASAVFSAARDTYRDSSSRTDDA